MALPVVFNRFAIDGAPVNEDSFPDVDFPPVVRYPEAQGIDGNGVPCRYVGGLWAEVGRRWISEEGRAYYYSKLTGGSASVVSVELFNPRENRWLVYMAEMTIPEMDGALSGSDYALTNFRVRFDNLV